MKMGWSYIWGGLNLGVVLFLRRSYNGVPLASIHKPLCHTYVYAILWPLTSELLCSMRHPVEHTGSALSIETTATIIVMHKSEKC